MTESAAQQVVLSNYPLSRSFKQRLEERYGNALRLINVAELRQVSLLNLLSHLRGIRAECLSVATEDERQRRAAAHSGS